MLIADTTANQIFGTIQPQGPAGTLTFSTLLTWGLRMFFFAMGMLALYYMLMGAFEWMHSSGDPKKIESAQAKITQSVVALVVSISILVAWVFLSTQILGIFKIQNGKVEVVIPSIGCKAAGTYATTATECCSKSALGSICQ